MKKDKWIWMPHAGHFCCGHLCRFHLNTYVGKYVVSTVGEMPYFNNEIKEIYKKSNLDYNKDFEEIGLGRLYETMVFKAKKSNNKCCLYEQKSGEDVDFKGYNTPEDAYAGHLKMCNKWSK